MKKFIFAFGAIVALSMTSCNGLTKTNVSSDSVTVDSVQVDSLDSIQMDSVAVDTLH